MAVPSKRARRPNGKRAREPLQQGHLDGLCGVYAIINAIRYVRPDVTQRHAQWLFERLNRALAKQNPARASAGRMVIHGLNRTEMRRLIEVARQQLALEFGITLKVEWLPKLGRRWHLAELWRVLAVQMSLGRVAVLGLGGRHAHWSVVIAVTPKQLRLFDSDRLRTIRRRQCTVGLTTTRIMLMPDEVFLFLSVKQNADSNRRSIQQRRSLRPWASQ